MFIVLQTFAELIRLDASSWQDAFTSLPNSIFAHRIVAEIYLREVDYANAIKIAENGLELVSRAELNSGRKLPQ